MKTFTCTALVWILVIFSLGLSAGETSRFPGAEGPGSKAAPFGGTMVNSGLYERDMTVSPDGRWLVYTIMDGRRGTLVYMERTEAGWTEPEVAPFSGRHSDVEPCFGPDGRLYFVSFRETKQGRLFATAWQDGTWADPVRVEVPVPDTANVYYPSFTANGDLYFTAEMPDTQGGEDLYMCPRTAEGYGSPVNLGPVVNSPRGEYNAFVSPDGSFILYNTAGAGPGVGGGDIWVSFHDEDGWHKPINLGETVNSPAFEFCPSLSPDGKVLFFTSHRSMTDYPEQISLEWLRQHHTAAGNGKGDIYWVSADVIASLRPKKE